MEETIHDCWNEYDKLNTKYLKLRLQLQDCGKLYVTTLKEVEKLKKDVRYWQKACQEISEAAYEEHLEK
jgi:hypothetical protein